MGSEIKVLSININCCEKCRNGVQNKIRKMPGVDNVAIDVEENLVYVFGEIEGTTLLNNVAKLGKPVQLLSADRSHADEHHHTRNEGRGCNNNPDRHGERGKQHSNCCCGDGRHHSSSSQKKAEEEHKCEDYVPPPISPTVCRDFFCKTHPRGRLITDRVAGENTSSYFGMPFYGGGVGPSQYPMGNEGWYGRQQPPPQFGYGRAMPRRYPHHNPYIFH
ncbi:hypothetical protein AAHA92_27262 [Salvia divinorum]|uniref:HMA domain-containing protein n=1 Tax=Salvia divinorum TaxID=28513 RepID=A0ABD1G340_SALDI